MAEMTGTSLDQRRQSFISSGLQGKQMDNITTVAPTEGMNPWERSMKGGYSKIATDVAAVDVKKQEVRDLGRKFSQILVKGEQSADQAVQEALSKYPPPTKEEIESGKRVAEDDIREFIPPKEFFKDPTTGEFDTYTYMERLAYGMAKYREFKQDYSKTDRAQKQQQSQFDSTQQERMGVHPDQVKSRQDALGQMTPEDKSLLPGYQENPQAAKDFAAEKYKQDMMDLRQQLAEQQNAIRALSARAQQNQPIESNALTTTLNTAYDNFTAANAAYEKNGKKDPALKQAVDIAKINLSAVQKLEKEVAKKLMTKPEYNQANAQAHLSARSEELIRIADLFNKDAQNIGKNDEGKLPLFNNPFNLKSEINAVRNKLNKLGFIEGKDYKIDEKTAKIILPNQQSTQPSTASPTTSPTTNLSIKLPPALMTGRP